ncbi:histidine biosynthesis protein [Thiorhodococcus drewsii AZ1]|uniref:Histidine biosynthesis protein n=2 Tax=Thiorhodococcus drewsii TaxID=210408 RepID=G2E7F4_9GAMM|nr:histidine biosynthesis protein [Thiorhodococcus drewsii AZ1]
MRKICRLEIKNDVVVKGVKFEGVKKVGTFAAAMECCEANHIEEIFLVDNTKSLYGLPPNFSALESVAKLTALPITFGGGIRTTEDAMLSFRLGAARVYLNSVLFQSGEIVEKIVATTGRQAIVGGVEYRVNTGRDICFSCAGREPSALGVAGRVAQILSFGVSEVILTSIDRDGTGKGFDAEAINLFDDIPIPVILSGGGSKKELSNWPVSLRTEGLAFSSAVIL